MPELPEVHTIVAQLSLDLHGVTIDRLSFFDTPKMLQPSPRTLARGVCGARIVSVTRCAKLIILTLTSGKILAVHLKLNGRLLLRPRGSAADTYTHAILTLRDGRELRFADSRKFGFLRLLTPDTYRRVRGTYGPDPLTRAFSPAALIAITRRRVKIKTLLLDQRRISGIGNIYSDEALYLAGIDPRRRAHTLTRAELVRLHHAIRTVLRAGIRHHGTSDQWFVDLYGRIGTHQNYLRVYGRDGRPCVRCKTRIVRVKFGSRSGRFCPHCQK